MSMPTMHIVCDRDDFKQSQVFAESNYWYVLDDGVIIPLLYEYGWCLKCGKMQHVEIVAQSRWKEKADKAKSTLDELESDKSKLSKSCSRWFFPKRISEKISTFDRQILFNENLLADSIDGLQSICAQRTVPHCLTCSSEDVISPFLH